MSCLFSGRRERERQCEKRRWTPEKTSPGFHARPTVPRTDSAPAPLLPHEALRGQTPPSRQGTGQPLVESHSAGALRPSLVEVRGWALQLAASQGTQGCCEAELAQPGVDGPPLLAQDSDRHLLGASLGPLISEEALGKCLGRNLERRVPPRNTPQPFQAAPVSHPACKRPRTACKTACPAAAELPPLPALEGHLPPAAISLSLMYTQQDAHLHLLPLFLSTSLLLQENKSPTAQAHHSHTFTRGFQVASEVPEMKLLGKSRGRGGEGELSLPPLGLSPTSNQEAAKPTCVHTCVCV